LNKKDIKILVADDTPVNVKIIQKFLEPRGFEVISAVNGQDAVDKFSEERPDIILMDIMMPVKDGYEATKEIKALTGDDWVPLIFLSAKSTIEDQIIGIRTGGDDYLTKPVDLSLLEAKLEAMLRIVNMQRKLNVATEKLKKFAGRASVEIELAKNLMDKMAEKKESVEPENFQLYAEAAEEISGDMALSYQCQGEGDSAKQYFMLADATGHGLTAAISLVPLSQLFYHLASMGENIADIAMQINQRLHSILPPDRFVAATLGFVDQAQGTIEIWNGANPIPVLLNTKGQVRHRFELTSFCLGMVSDTVFSAKTETIQYDEDCELLFFSDGVIDAKNENGEIFGNEGINRSLALPLQANHIMFDRIKDDLNAFRDHDNKVDDICLLSIKCRV